MRDIQAYRVAWTEVTRYIRAEIGGSRRLANAKHEIEDAARKAFDHMADNNQPMENAKAAGMNAAWFCCIVRTMRDGKARAEDNSRG